MKLAMLTAGLLLANCSLSSAQGVLFYGGYYAPAPIVVQQPMMVVPPAQTIVQMSYVPQPQFAYAATVASPVYVQSAPVFVQPAPVYVQRVAVAPPVVVAPAMSVAHSPFSVAARETARATRNGIDYRYREYGPLGFQRYHYTVNSRPHGYVIREGGH